jgi:hypothetical protein
MNSDKKVTNQVNLIEELINTLERRKINMIHYLVDRVEIEDWHGVMDAAADIREIEAQLKTVERFNK